MFLPGSEAGGISLAGYSVPFPQLEQLMPESRTSKFKAYAKDPANILWISSIKRATSNITKINDVYTNLLNQRPVDDAPPTKAKVKTTVGTAPCEGDARSFEIWHSAGQGRGGGSTRTSDFARQWADGHADYNFDFIFSYSNVWDITKDVSVLPYPSTPRNPIPLNVMCRDITTILLILC